MVLVLLLGRGMTLRTSSRTAARARHVTLVLLLLTGRSAWAADRSSLPGGAHVRPTSPAIGRVLDSGLLRSPHLRELIRSLEGSDVIVYVSETPAMPSQLTGFLAYMATAGGFRYLRVFLPAHKPGLTLIPALGHELQHAVEIAGAPAIVDASSLARHYQTVGFDTTTSRTRRCYESLAAIQAGHRVRMDVSDWRPGVRTKVTRVNPDEAKVPPMESGILE